MNYRISVLMGIYNCAPYLQEALDSLYAQTYQDFKIILCEDGSKDDTYAVAKQYADKYEIPVLDYTYMNICYDTAYFFNAMHLNKTGAEIFSDTLANDIKRLGIINGILE